jgi:hypothetical protein
MRNREERKRAKPKRPRDAEAARPPAQSSSAEMRDEKKLGNGFDVLHEATLCSIEGMQEAGEKISSHFVTPEVLVVEVLEPFA